MEEHLAHLTSDKNYKSIAYENLAEAYFYAGQYANATRAYKKLMMLAWQQNDDKSEMKAFNGLALQYFYAGEIDKCEFLLDRVMRGKKENQNSKIRLLTLRRLEYQRKEKAYHRVEFKDVHKWADEQEQEEAVRKDYVHTYEFNPYEAVEDD